MKKGISVLLVLLVAVPIAVVAVAGCGSSPTPQQAKQQLNTDLESLKSSLTEFTNPTTYSSKDSVQSAIDNVQKDFDAVVKSAKEVKSVSTSTLTSAWNELKKSISDTVNSSESISQKLDSVQTAVKNFQQAWQKLIDQLKTQ
jgi:hypothetical protein